MGLSDIAHEIGLDMDLTLARFGGQEALYFRFLKKWLLNTGYDSAMECYQNSDIGQLEREIHGMKGVTANLGLMSLSNSCAAVIGTIREGKKEELKNYMKQWENTYRNTVDLLKNSTEMNE